LSATGVRMEMKMKRKHTNTVLLKSNIQKLAKKELPTVPITTTIDTQKATTTKARGCPQLGEAGNGRKYLPTPLAARSCLAEISWPSADFSGIFLAI